MTLQLGALSLPPIIHADLEAGGSGALLRAVDAESVRIDVAGWQTSFDGVAVLFLLDGIYRAVLSALQNGPPSGFFCLDDPAGGKIISASPGRVRILIADQESEVSGFDLLASVVGAMMEVADFLAINGFGEAATKLIVRAMSDPETL